MTGEARPKKMQSYIIQTNKFIIQKGVHVEKSLFLIYSDNDCWLLVTLPGYVRNERWPGSLTDTR